MKVFAYLRVSTAEQVAGGGHERQERAIQEFCAARGWEIMRVFKDQQSGAAPVEARLMLLEALDLCGKDSVLGVNAIVVESATRLSRDLMHQEIFLAMCRKRGVEVYGADNGEELALAEAEPTRVLIRQILGALSQWERAIIRERLMEGRRKKKRETGKPCGGPAPYGDAKDPARRACEQAVIDFIMEAHYAGKSHLQIAYMLREEGFPSANGNRLWSTSSIWRIIERSGARSVEEKYEKNSRRTAGVDRSTGTAVAQSS